MSYKDPIKNRASIKKLRNKRQKEKLKYGRWRLKKSVKVESTRLQNNIIIKIIEKNQPIHLYQIWKIIKSKGFNKTYQDICYRVTRLILKKELITKKVKTKFGRKTDKRFVAINNGLNGHLFDNQNLIKKLIGKKPSK